jgi:hypothetical protein
MQDGAERCRNMQNLGHGLDTPGAISFRRPLAHSNRAMPPPRHFRQPWTVKEHDESFEVVDADGESLAFVYFADDKRNRYFIQMRLGKDEARRLANQIARIPELRAIEKAAASGVSSQDEGE